MITGSQKREVCFWHRRIRPRRLLVRILSLTFIFLNFFKKQPQNTRKTSGSDKNPMEFISFVHTKNIELSLIVLPNFQILRHFYFFFLFCQFCSLFSSFCKDLRSMAFIFFENTGDSHNFNSIRRMFSIYWCNSISKISEYK